MNIKQLFDPSRDIYRSIEKVIAYGVSQEERLKKEVSEYVVTDSIDEQFNKLLLKMQAAMDAGGENEVGVWVPVQLIAITGGIEPASLLGIAG
jgi:hypothetical protein